LVKKFQNFLKREILYYIITLVILTLVMHIDLLTDPLSRFQIMQEKENYFHPFLYAFIVYIIILIIRKIIDFITGMFHKNS